MTIAAENTAKPFVLIHSFGEVLSDNLTAMLELADAYFYHLGRSVQISGPRGWIWCDGAFVGDYANNGGYVLG